MKRPAHITHVNGIETSAINIADRGLAYGDGVFETMRVVQGKIPLLDWHLKRFLRGVEVLGFGQSERLQTDFLKYLTIALDEIKNNACLETSLIKLIVTRGSNGRGYMPPIDPHCQFVVQVFDRPDYPLDYQQQGIVLKECEYRLAYQPQLAGIKHLNRLDQVLASQELLGLPEGLMLDYQDRVIEGTKSNLLVFQKGQVITPKLDNCGVQGVLRDALMAASAEKKGALNSMIQERDISLTELEQSDGLAMINSVFGLWPVRTLSYVDGSEIHYTIPPECEKIRDYLETEFLF